LFNKDLVTFFITALGLTQKLMIFFFEKKKKYLRSLFTIPHARIFS